MIADRGRLAHLDFRRGEFLDRQLRGLRTFQVFAAGLAGALDLRHGGADGRHGGTGGEADRRFRPERGRLLGGRWPRSGRVGSRPAGVAVRPGGGVKVGPSN